LRQFVLAATYVSRWNTIRGIVQTNTRYPLDVTQPNGNLYLNPSTPFVLLAGKLTGRLRHLTSCQWVTSAVLPVWLLLLAFKFKLFKLPTSLSGPTRSLPVSSVVHSRPHCDGRGAGETLYCAVSVTMTGRSALQSQVVQCATQASLLSATSPVLCVWSFNDVYVSSVKLSFSVWAADPGDACRSSGQCSSGTCGSSFCCSDAAKYACASCTSTGTCST
jgi:hypothetical protein